MQTCWYARSLEPQFLHIESEFSPYSASVSRFGGAGCKLEGHDRSLSVARGASENNPNFAKGLVISRTPRTHR